MDLPKGLIMDLGADRKEHSSWGKEGIEVMCWSGAQGPGKEARNVVVGGAAWVVEESRPLHAEPPGFP